MFSFLYHSIEDFLCQKIHRKPLEHKSARHHNLWLFSLTNLRPFHQLGPLVFPITHLLVCFLKRCVLVCPSISSHLFQSFVCLLACLFVCFVFHR